VGTAGATTRPDAAPILFALVNARRTIAFSAAALAGLAVCCGGGAAAETTAPASTPTCSAARLSPKLPKLKLPANVAATRMRIAAAAVRCDYDALAAIARQNPAGFTFSYGGERSAAAYWRRLETKHLDRPLARLVKILGLPHTRNETRAYAWPSAYSERPTAAAWNALIRGGVYSRAQVTQMKKAGTYLGYRTAISPRGRWLFFVAGD
jgi:hypothetical protein